MSIDDILMFFGLVWAFSMVGYMIKKFYDYIFKKK